MLFPWMSLLVLRHGSWWLPKGAASAASVQLQRCCNELLTWEYEYVMMLCILLDIKYLSKNTLSWVSRWSSWLLSTFVVSLLSFHGKRFRVLVMVMVMAGWSDYLGYVRVRVLEGMLFQISWVTAIIVKISDLTFQMIICWWVICQFKISITWVNRVCQMCFAHL